MVVTIIKLLMLACPLICMAADKKVARPAQEHYQKSPVLLSLDNPKNWALYDHRYGVCSRRKNGVSHEQLSARIRQHIKQTRSAYLHYQRAAMDYSNYIVHKKDLSDAGEHIEFLNLHENLAAYEKALDDRLLTSFLLYGYWEEKKKRIKLEQEVKMLRELHPLRS